METLVDKKDKINIKEFLEDFYELKEQYLFFDCFIISSQHFMNLYQRAQEKANEKFNNIEIYYTPNYLYDKNKNNQIFEQINKQVNKNFYFLKEHIFYYQYLLQCIQLKKEMELKGQKIKKEELDTTHINEIFYRTLLNRLYLLCDQPNFKSNNYGLSEIFGVPCIYSVVEPNIIDQIINMKKFSYELMKMEESKVIQLFGINQDFELQSYIYNKLLISISETNSTNKEEKSFSDDFNQDINKINRNIIEMENFLVNFSSELFLFYYITNQFDKNKLIQIPRMIFFCNLYNDNCENIYQIYSKKKNERNNEEEKIIIQENEIIKEKEVKIVIRVNKKKAQPNQKAIEKTINKLPQKKEKKQTIKEEAKPKFVKQGKKEKDENNKNLEIKNETKKEKEQSLKNEKFEKNLLKCKLMKFVGTLEIDGAFKYIGDTKEIETKSLVILMSEYISIKNENIKNYAEKYEAKGIIEKLDKYKNNIAILKSSLRKNKIFKVDVEKEPLESLKKKYEEIANKNITFNKTKNIKKGDIIILENKREYPNHMSDEVYNFLEHSLFFIGLYKKLKLIETTSEIHLLFVYDHSRNYNDEGQTVMGLYNFINESFEKLNLFKNKIKFYLIHSLPNLSITIFDKLGKNISDLNEENNKFSKSINDLTKENKILKENIQNLKNDNKRLIIKLANIKSQNKRNEKENAILKNTLLSLVRENDNLRKEVNNLKYENKNHIKREKELIEIVKGLKNKVEQLEKEINELKSNNNRVN